MNISVNNIVSHENNPRKALGDLTELRDSIAKNGILQPLTVVPFRGGYKVVIGHRRLEAARLAGLEEVPCDVKELSEAEQLNVMMMENMMREALTTYEEAKGFQMMLDLGKTVEEVSEETGFSQTTVRNRTKLLSLDEDKFKKSVERGATLQDLVKLYDIEDEHTRNAVLNSAGTADFNSKLNNAVKEERNERKFTDAKLKVEAFATKVNNISELPSPNKYVTSIYKWNVQPFNNPEDGNEYYCISDEQTVRIYMKGDPDVESREKEERERRQAIETAMDDKAMSCYELRRNFIRNFGNFKKYGKLIMQEYMKASFRDAMRTSWRSLELGIVPWLLDIDPQELYDNVDKLDEFPIEKVALYMLFAYNDSEDECSWKKEWTKQDDGTYGYVYRYAENDKLIKWYGFLTSIGYHISQEETLMLNGDVDNVIKEAA